MYGIFIAGARPKSKKEIKALCDLISVGLQTQDWKLGLGQSGPTRIPAVASDLVLEATSMFGNEFDGSMALALQADNGDPHQTLMGRGFTFVGPDPYRNRKFYGSISLKTKGSPRLVVT